MSLVSTVFKYAEYYDINITFRRKADKLILVIVPKITAKDADLKKDIEKLPPLTITEKPKIIEDNFDELVSAALSKSAGIQENIAEFDKAADKLSKKVEEKTGKKVEPAKEEKKENGLFDKKQAGKGADKEEKPEKEEKPDKEEKNAATSEPVTIGADAGDDTEGPDSTEDAGTGDELENKSGEDKESGTGEPVEAETADMEVKKNDDEDW